MKGGDYWNDDWYFSYFIVSCICRRDTFWVHWLSCFQLLVEWSCACWGPSSGCRAMSMLVMVFLELFPGRIYNLIFWTQAKQCLTWVYFGYIFSVIFCFWCCTFWWLFFLCSLRLQVYSTFQIMIFLHIPLVITSVIRGEYQWKWTWVSRLFSILWTKPIVWDWVLWFCLKVSQWEMS